MVSKRKKELLIAFGFAIIAMVMLEITVGISHIFHPAPTSPPSINNPLFFNKTTGSTLEWLSDSKIALFVNKLSQVDTNNSTIYVIKFYIGNPTDHTIYVDFFDAWLSNSTYSVRLRYQVSQELAPKKTLVKYVDTKNSNFSSSEPTKFNIAIYQKDNGFSLYNVYL